MKKVFFKYLVFITIIISFLFVGRSTIADVDPQFDLLINYGSDTSKLIFAGKQHRIAYISDRKLSEAPFTIKNLSNEKKEIRLLKVYLAGVKIDTELKDSEFRVFQKGAYRNCNFFIVKPKSEQEFKVLFEPFKFYPGYRYDIKVLIMVDGKKMTAVSKTEIMREKRRDRNWFKDKPK